MKFCDIPIGTRFLFQDEVYIKISSLVARHEADGDQKFFRRASQVRLPSDSAPSATVGPRNQFPYARIQQAMDEFCEGFRRDIRDLEAIEPIDVEYILERGREDFLRKFK